MLRKAVVSVVFFFGIFSQAFAGYGDMDGGRFVRYPDVLSQAIDVLPPGFTTIVVGPHTYYYADGYFYQKYQLEQKYILVPPPIGATVYRIPAGYQMMMIKGHAFYVANGVSYVRTLLGYRVIPPLV